MSPETSLNRSLSAPDISNGFIDSYDYESYLGQGVKSPKLSLVRRIYVEQVYQVEPQNLFKHFSSDQIYGKSDISVIRSINSHSINRIGTKTNNELYPDLEELTFTNITSSDIIPMDIDETCVEPQQPDYSSETNTHDNILPRNNYKSSLNIKNRKSMAKKHLIDVLNEDKDTITRCPSPINKLTNSELIPMNQNIKQSSFRKMTLSILLSSIVLYVIFISDFLLYVNEDVRVTNLRKDLTDNVHDQKNINIVIKSLEDMPHWSSKIKILGFVGTSGVGKTFVANIIKQNFYYRLTNEINKDDLYNSEKTNSVIKDLRECCCNLIVIDDLQSKDLDGLMSFIQKLPKNHFILVIPIFNTQFVEKSLNHNVDPKYIVNIHEKFEGSGSFYEFVVFNEFNSTSVEKWVLKNLQKRNVDVRYYDEIMNTILYEHNIKYHGLKGLHQKMVMELEKLHQ